MTVESFWIGVTNVVDAQTETQNFLLRVLKTGARNWCEYYFDGASSTTRDWKPTDEELDRYVLREVSPALWDLAVIKGYWDGRG